jgi:hypothetical protein
MDDNDYKLQLKKEQPSKNWSANLGQRNTLKDWGSHETFAALIKKRLKIYVIYNADEVQTFLDKISSEMEEILMKRI